MGVGSVHRLFALWKRNARPVTVVFCPLQHVIHLVQNRHAVLRAGGALERDIKQRKLHFLNDVSSL